MTDTTPGGKVHKITLEECYEQGYKDGRIDYHDAALWHRLSCPKQRAYDRGNTAGRENPRRC